MRITGKIWSFLKNDDNVVNNQFLFFQVEKYKIRKKSLCALANNFETAALKMMDKFLTK